MRSDDDYKGAGKEESETAEAEPTGRATPVVVAPRGPVSARARGASPKSKGGRSKAAESASAPRSRRAPVAASPESKKKSATTPAKKSAAPARPRRSRVPPRPEASIPPTWSDVGAGGEAVPVAEVSPILPPPMSTLVATPEVPVPDVASDAFPPPVRSSRVSPYVRAAAGAVAAVALVMVARGFAHRAPRPVPASEVVAAAGVEPAPAPPVEPTLEAIAAPVAEDLESPEGLKRASLEALEQRKLDESVAAGEKATQLDPTDADAWLILGAAYHDQGNFAAARRSYAACAKQATHGEVRECKFLIQ